ncbi:MAG: hypothetical protein GF344_05400 [Chitinivibrionales bacterium]|nr:hypothetical protein [Chitinivibrionales bacterium]
MIVADFPVNREDRREAANALCWCGSGRKFKNCHGRERGGKRR